MGLSLAPLGKLLLVLAMPWSGPAPGGAIVSQPVNATFQLLGPDGRPLLGPEDLEGYEWATHVLHLRPGARDRLAAALTGSLVSGVPFTVSAGGQACYQGVFTTSVSSKPQSTPVIDLMPVEAPSGDRLAIELGYPTADFFQGQDPRGDERVRQALAALGKLR
jgi:hypothetical protein